MKDLEGRHVSTTGNLSVSPECWANGQRQKETLK